MKIKNKDIPSFVMVVGLPGAGKSSFLKDWLTKGKEKINIHSSDNIRKELLGDEGAQTDNTLVFETLHNRVKEDLINGISCCYDATNISEKYRKAFFFFFKNIKCKKVCYIIATPIEECIKRDEARTRHVGKNVILKMYKNFNIPSKREGWDDIFLCYSSNSKGSYSIEDIFKRLKFFDQHNPHHNLTVGDHCMRTYEEMKKICSLEENLSKTEKALLLVASMIHDIGKEKTATFINMKGEKTDICHFYGHENVGAYDSLFLDLWTEEKNSNSFILAVADLIQLHMKLYSNPDSEKYKEKLRRKIGDSEYRLLTLLHEADINGK